MRREEGGRGGAGEGRRGKKLKSRFAREWPITNFSKDKVRGVEGKAGRGSPSRRGRVRTLHFTLSYMYRWLWKKNCEGWDGAKHWRSGDDERRGKERGRDSKRRSSKRNEGDCLNARKSEAKERRDETRLNTPDHSLAGSEEGRKEEEKKKLFFFLLSFAATQFISGVSISLIRWAAEIEPERKRKKGTERRSKAKGETATASQPIFLTTYVCACTETRARGQAPRCNVKETKYTFSWLVLVWCYQFKWACRTI